MQLKVSTKSGETMTFSLPHELGYWRTLEDSADFQAGIRGMGLVHAGSFHALPLPVAFRRVRYMVEARQTGAAEPTAFRVGYTADEITAWLTVYVRGNPPLCRFDLRRTGRMVWRP